MAWWMWIVLGFILALAEVATPGGFYLIFFGASALVVGFLDSVTMAGPPWMQWLLFSVLSVVAIVLVRKPLVDKFSARGAGADGATVDTDKIVGEVAVAAESIASGAFGRVEMRGTAWKACNRGGQALATGQRCVVERVEGLTLEVRPQA